jgi:hypothetical protein
MTRRALAWVFSSALAGLAAAGPPWVAADPGAPAVTRDNLLASERFWPYQVELRDPLVPLAAGTIGVLVRVEPAGLARIDFGRDGRRVVAVEQTDVVERAEQVRRGELWKPAPNLVHAIGARLVDPDADPPRALEPLALLGAPAVLSVFADPAAEAFGEIAAALAPLCGRHGVATVFFPQGERPGPETRDRLRAAGWAVPFAMDAFVQGYTSALLDDGLSPPAILLQSPEGRVLVQSAWRPGLADELRSAIDGAFGGAERARAP